MPPQPTRKAQKAATRRALKESALACFAESGLNDTSIAAIASRAGVANGTFYVHFLSKEALLDELLAEFNIDLAAALTPVWRDLPETDLVELVERTAGIFLDFWSDRRAFVEIYALRLSHGVGLADLRDGINPPAVDLLSGALERLATSLGVESPPIELVTQAILSMWARVGLQVLFNDEVARCDGVEVLTKMTMGALNGVFLGLVGDNR